QHLPHRPSLRQNRHPSPRQSLLSIFAEPRQTPGATTSAVGAASSTAHLRTFALISSLVSARFGPRPAVMSCNVSVESGATPAASQARAAPTAESRDPFTAGRKETLSSPITNPGAALQVVDTDDGPVTLTTIEYLEQLTSSLRTQLEQLSGEIGSAGNQRGELQGKAGCALTRHLNDWSPGERMPRIEAARGLESLVETLSQSLSEITARRIMASAALLATSKINTKQPNSRLSAN